jgi:hypothetical protein
MSTLWCAPAMVSSARSFHPFLFENLSGWNVVTVSRLKTKRRPLELLEESTEIRGYARKDGQTRLGTPRTAPSSV